MGEIIVTVPAQVAVLLRGALHVELIRACEDAPQAKPESDTRAGWVPVLRCLNAAFRGLDVIGWDEPEEQQPVSSNPANVPCSMACIRSSQLPCQIISKGEPLLPSHAPDPRGGRPRSDDRACFGAIMYVMLTGIAWRHLPRELGVSPATAHRRLKEWERAGVWARLHAEMLRRLNAKGAIDWNTGVVDGSHVRALRGGSRWALAG